MKKFMFILIALALLSCTARRNALKTTDRIVTDTVYVVQRDSSAVKTHDVRVDSVYVDRWHTTTTSGDTVYKTDSVVLFRYLFRDRVDTIYMEREMDSTSVKTEAVSTVEKNEVVKRDHSIGVLLILCALCAFLFFVWTRLRKR